MTQRFFSDFREKSLHKKAKFALTLTVWVLFVCLMQNSGVLKVCSLPTGMSGVSTVGTAPAHLQKNMNTTLHARSLSGLSPDSAQLTDTTSSRQTGDQQANEECHLSSQLLTFHIFDLDSLWLITLVVMVLALGVYRVQRIPFTPFTEPIFSRYRIHLRHCTFQE
ncbi:hypothetical protein [Vibrio methylphosphonaticus]|uniref:hypothetical protein n=1 Tax=Vibrio methylphosphonaticus TaxID=2946866 RepID=UPI00202A7B6D|nr:hypothetical protein [Vibrio methylphosphonaticus]MCL9774222.1 hypothetical protein [Vibrio methylphosphonaticus]